MTEKATKPVPTPGAVFGSWTVVEEVPSPGKDRRWLCRCACGTEKL